ncbi:TetR/AcrR family transcriptional regulator [Mycolicibacterium grossiae]|uniref:TetR/AcrR family transcriptional regulator n=2 Tax=Mycolicibacterium grossiae TaxID=1552759 RepID=UPI0009F25B5E|nr:TetR/AcrR family transcriptional regulator [Mycolicibacterium grossiae]QEM43546.1 TetR/AcrR family transcriptional regulator [Mycolicibacterium grossiae]
MTTTMKATHDSHGHSNASGRRRRRTSGGEDSRTTRQKIIDSARQCIVERVILGATNQLIAERSGVSRPAVRYTFPHKPDLYEAVQIDSISLLQSLIEESSANENRTLQDVITTFVRALEERTNDRDAVKCLLTAVIENQRQPDLFPRSESVLRLLRTFTYQHSQDALMRSEIANVDALPVEALCFVLCVTSFYIASLDDPQAPGVGAALSKLLGGTLWSM